MPDLDFPWLRALLAALADPEVDEVLVNGARAAWAVTSAGSRALTPPFADDDAWLDALIDFAVAVGVRLDPVVGSAGGSLADGVRWHALLPPLTRDGPLFSLRRHRFGELGIEAFGGGTRVKRALRATFRRGAPLLIAGPTGSGKTTLLHALLAEEAAHERVVIIETLAELPSPSSHCVRLLTRPPGLDGRGAVDAARLQAEALRLRPDRMVVGELRGPEAGAFLAAAASGHGAVATIHAATAAAALARLWTLAGCGFDAAGLANVHVALVERGRPPRLVEVAGYSTLESQRTRHGGRLA